MEEIEENIKFLTKVAAARRDVLPTTVDVRNGPIIVGQVVVTGTQHIIL